MWKSIRALDRILRGEATRTADLRQGNLDVPIGGLAVVIMLLGAFYGACMGMYSIITRHGDPSAAMGYQQMGASAAKVPLLFFLTLVVTFPSLYVFNALVGSRLSLTALLRLLIASLGVVMSLLASFGTIVVFFAVSGFLGLGFLLQTLHRLYNAQIATPPPIPPPAPAQPDPIVGGAGEPPDRAPLGEPYVEPGALERLEGQISSRNVRTVFRIWVLVFGLVGAQMGWVMRPFIGDPTKPFTFFRPRESNFFEAVIGTAADLLSWDDSRERRLPASEPPKPPAREPASRPELESGT